MTKISKRCRTIESVAAFKNGTVLDIGDSSGEYSIESASTLVVAVEVLAFAVSRRHLQEG